MIPRELTLSEVSKVFDDLYRIVAPLQTGNLDLRGQRVMNAGQPIDSFDYVRKFDLDKMTKSITFAQAADRETLLTIKKSTRVGPFSTRGSSVGHIYELFMANDMDYIGWVSTGGAWVYVYGIRSIAQADIATFTAFLGTNDVGCLINVTDFTHRLRWTGTALEFAAGDSGSGYIQSFPITPTGGTWGICDGTAYSYLKADGTTANFTTPDYSTAAYLKLGTSAVIGPTAASGATTSVSAGTPSGTNGDNNADVELVVSTGSGVIVAANPHSHTFTGNALAGHSHGPNTLELRRTQLIGYFRR